ncbi:MAG: hypothetical protein JWM10_2267, partial [Myxococcaceae bacterium]|nr:hypothetical protein [Myxococcaceae bacterium]
GATPTITFAPAAAVRVESGRTVAVRAGAVTAACAFPSLSLADATPARFTITPGDPARVTTTLDHASIAAGETATATCAVTDAEGNAVTGAAATLRLSPMGMGAAVTGLAARVERAGAYTAACVVPGASGDAAMLTVRPGLPASLAIARSPDMPLYARGASVDVPATVSDRYGNRVPDAMLTYTSTPSADIAGSLVTFPREGRYTVTVRVGGMTDGGRELVQMTSFVVDSSGPSIDCVGPAHGSMVNAAAGSTLTFQARLSDTTGVRAVTINGRAVTAGNDGAVSAPITTRWGVNFVDVTATDVNGQENSRTCAFLASDRWNGEAANLTDGVQLLLRQDAVDDGDPTAPITSIDDVLQRVVNSQGLRDQLHSSLLAANPLKANSCDQTVFGVCVFRSEVNYERSELNGPNTTTLSLVDGGLRAVVRFQNIRVRLRINGTLSTSGWVDVASLEVGVTFDLSASGGRPHAAVRAGSVTTTVGRISTDFSGITGAIVDVVVSLANGTVRSVVSNALRDYVSTNFSRVLDGVLSGLDVSSLGATFNVPRLDGAGATPLRFGVNVSSVSDTAARLRFGLGTLLSTSMPAHARATRGVALPPGDAGDPTVSTPATVAVHVAVLNQALHSLWRGGWLDVGVPAARFSSALPAGSRFDVTGLLPPVAFLRTDGRINLDLGALEVAFTIPGASEPFRLSVGARASGAITLSGNTLRFGAVTLDEVKVSITSESIPMSERDALVTGLRALVQQYVERSLNDALPAIPIPGFTIPASLSTYGLPVGAQLGIRTPALATARQRFELRGGFGQR